MHIIAYNAGGSPNWVKEEGICFRFLCTVLDINIVIDRTFTN